MEPFPGKGQVLGRYTGTHIRFPVDSPERIDHRSSTVQMDVSSSRKSVSSSIAQPRGRNGGTQRWAAQNDDITSEDDEDTSLSAATFRLGQNFRGGRSRSRGRSSSSSKRSRPTSAPLPDVGKKVYTLPISKGYIGTQRLEKRAIEARLHTIDTSNSSYPRLLVARVEESDEKAILDVRRNHLTEIAMYISADSDPEYPSFLALSTVSNERSATGHTRVCDSYKPGKFLFETDSGSQYILLILDSECEALESFKENVKDALLFGSYEGNVLLHEIEAPSEVHTSDPREKYLRALRCDVIDPSRSKQPQQQQIDQHYFSPRQKGQTVKPGIIAVGSDDDDDDEIVESYPMAIPAQKRKTKTRQNRVCDDPNDDDSSGDDDNDDDDDFIVDDMHGKSGYTTKSSSKKKRRDPRGKGLVDKVPKKASGKKMLKRPRPADNIDPAYASESEWIKRAGSIGLEQPASRSSKRVAEQSKEASVSTTLDNNTDSDFEEYVPSSLLAYSNDNAVKEADAPRERESAPSWASGINSFSDDDPRLSQVLFRYPEGATAQDPVPINLGDVRRLRPGQYLNDNLIDFWLKYSFNKRIENAIDPSHCGAGDESDLKAMSKKVHIFSSHFYTKLTEQRKGDVSTQPGANVDAGHARHRRVRRWTKAMNIFEYDFIMVPVNMNLHWSLAVICYPGELVKEIAPELQTKGRVEPNDEDDGTQSEHSEDATLEGGGRGFGDSSTEILHSNVCEMMSNEEHCEGQIAADVGDPTGEGNVGLTNEASIDLCESSDEDIESGRESEDYGPSSKVTLAYSEERLLADAAREEHSADLPLSQETVPYSQEDHFVPEHLKAPGDHEIAYVSTSCGIRQGRNGVHEELNELLNEVLESDGAEGRIAHENHASGGIENAIEAVNGIKFSCSSSVGMLNVEQNESFYCDVNADENFGLDEPADGNDGDDRDGIVLMEEHEQNGGELPEGNESVEVGGDGRFPCILIMDSLRYHDSNQICAYLRDWLNHEHAARAKSAQSGNSEQANAASAQTPCNDTKSAAEAEVHASGANGDSAPVDAQDECEEDSVVPMEADAAKEFAEAIEAARLNSGGPSSEEPPVPRLFNAESLPKVEPEVPRQENSWDCGVFVLAYADAVMDLCPEILGAPCVSSPSAIDTDLNSGTQKATENGGEDSNCTQSGNLSDKFTKELRVADLLAARERAAIARLTHLKSVFGASLFNPRDDIRARRRRLKYLVFRLCTSIPSETVEAPTVQAHTANSGTDSTRVDPASSKSLPLCSSSASTTNGKFFSVTQPGLLDSPPRVELNREVDEVVVLSGDSAGCSAHSGNGDGPTDSGAGALGADELVVGKRAKLDSLQTLGQAPANLATRFSCSMKKPDPEATESDVDDSSSFSDDNLQMTARSIENTRARAADRKDRIEQSPKRFVLQAAPDLKRQRPGDEGACNEVREDSEGVDVREVDGKEVGSSDDAYDPSGSFKPAAQDQGRKKREVVSL